MNLTNRQITRINQYPFRFYPLFVPFVYSCNSCSSFLKIVLKISGHFHRTALYHRHHTSAWLSSLCPSRMQNLSTLRDYILHTRILQGLSSLSQESQASLCLYIPYIQNLYI